MILATGRTRSETLILGFHSRFLADYSWLPGYHLPRRDLLEHRYQANRRDQFNVQIMRRRKTSYADNGVTLRLLNRSKDLWFRRAQSTEGAHLMEGVLLGRQDCLVGLNSERMVKDPC